MAKVYKKSNALINRYKAIKSAILKSWIIALFISTLLFAILYFGKTNALLLLIPLPPIIAFIITAFRKRELDILVAGIAGEQNSAKLISALPDSYCGFQNLNVTFDGKQSEIDLTVVGPTGIFIIEVKNLNGTVVGDYQSNKWTQHKIGRGGTPYSKQFYSPVKQVGTHIYRLANFLRQNGIREYVNGCVYFANYESELRIHGIPDKIPVFDSFDTLCRYILSGEKILNGEQVTKICKFLKGIKR